MPPIEKLEEQFIARIDEAWTAFYEALEEGQEFLEAEEEFYNIMEEAIEDFHRQAYAIGQIEATPEDDDRPPAGLLGFSDSWPTGIRFQLERLRIALDQIQTAYEVQGGVSSLFLFKPRILSYGKAIWNPYLRGTMYYDDPDAQYVWEGFDIPGGGDVDYRICAGCEWQVRQPPRTLAQMDKLPGEEECGVRCRHRLKRVR